jgi:hypothetical protein
MPLSSIFKLLSIIKAGKKEKIHKNTKNKSQRIEKNHRKSRNHSEKIKRNPLLHFSNSLAQGIFSQTLYQAQ